MLHRFFNWLNAFMLRRRARADEVNQRAAEWWASKFYQRDKREAFKAALLRYLPAKDWIAYNEYDPQGLLLHAVRHVGPCLGAWYSGSAYFPEKTGIRREGDKLFIREGYRQPWLELKEDS